MSRNRHPFEGERNRSKGALRLWTGQQAGYSPYHKRKIPMDALVVLTQVPDLATANALIRLRTPPYGRGRGTQPPRLRGTGFENAVFDEPTKTWWMLTGG